MDFFDTYLRGKPLPGNYVQQEMQEYYNTFRFSDEIYEWMNSTEQTKQICPDLFDGYNYEKRINLYDQAVVKLARFAEYNNYLNIPRIRFPQDHVVTIYRYIVELIPTLDFLNLYYHDPKPPLNIYFKAAKEYDPECYNAAVKMLHSDPMYFNPLNYRDDSDENFGKLLSDVQQILNP